MVKRPSPSGSGRILAFARDLLRCDHGLEECRSLGIIGTTENLITHEASVAAQSFVDDSHKSPRYFDGSNGEPLSAAMYLFSNADPGSGLSGAPKRSGPPGPCGELEV